MQTLHGHTSPDTAYVVADYPYGFRLRCRIRYWIETKRGHGQRLVSQTTNPKRGHAWNTPKASTYSTVLVMYLNDAGHVQTASVPYPRDEATISAFEQAYAAGLTGAYEQDAIRRLRAANRVRERVTWTVCTDDGAIVRHDPTCPGTCGTQTPAQQSDMLARALRGELWNDTAASMRSI